MAIVDVAVHVEIATHTNSSVILKFDETTGAMHKPELSDWGGGWQLNGAKCCANNDPMIGIALLRQHHYLIAR